MFNHLILLTANVGGSAKSTDGVCVIKRHVQQDCFQGQPKPLPKGRQGDHFKSHLKSKETKKFLQDNGMSEKYYRHAVDMFWDTPGFIENGYQVTVG